MISGKTFVCKDRGTFIVTITMLNFQIIILTLNQIKSIEIKTKLEWNYTSKYNIFLFTTLIIKPHYIQYILQLHETLILIFLFYKHNLFCSNQIRTLIC